LSAKLNKSQGTFIRNLSNIKDAKQGVKIISKKHSGEC